jgi:tetratricopeptide (TPR) repeat protein
MNRVALLACWLLVAGGSVRAQQSSSAPANPGSPVASGQDTSSYPAADEPDAQESSSRETRTDISPPKDDAKNHPDSKSAVGDLVPTAPAPADVQEFHPWNPMKAAKDIEVGDYYFRRKNYKAALDRYKEALYYKENDAVATYRLAVCQEKLGDKDGARKNFEQYLKILPEGPLAKDARASLEKLGKKEASNR